MAQEKQAAKTILLPDFITVRELAELTGSSPIAVMKKLIANGIMASINQQVDYDTAAIIVEDMGFDPQSAAALKAREEREQRAATAQTWRRVYNNEREENLKRRPPIVTILGHVDHGKTTLLDTIRKAKVAEGEAGGITQHIGAYRVIHNNQQITFLDTPGHEAFTSMRARGAAGADIAILVVAADDGVMQTTKEALSHARAANVPIVVAITKTDKRNANTEKVKQELSEIGLTPQDWDGETFVVPVSAQQNAGIDDLLEAIQLTAEQSEIIANPNGDPTGTVLEARVDRNRGVIATVLVFNGTLKVGDEIVSGTSYGRIKAMYDETGKAVKAAGPSTPVQVLGMHDLPNPGDPFETVKNEKTARTLVTERKEQQDAQRRQPARAAVTLEDIFAQVKSGEAREMTTILKVDVQGSLQPIVSSLDKIAQDNHDGIRLRLLQSDVGNISESDIMLASASGAIILGFNVDLDSGARKSAETHGVEVRQYDTIYRLLEDIELALKGMLEPVYADKVIGTAEVRQVFRISKVGTIAGCMIKDGEARRNAKARVKRGGKVMIEGAGVSSLKRMQEDVREVRQGFECGIGVANFSDFEAGDLIEFYITERVS